MEVFNECNTTMDDTGRQDTAENQATDSTAQGTSFTQAEIPSINDCRKIAWRMSHKKSKKRVTELVAFIFYQKDSETMNYNSECLKLTIKYSYSFFYAFMQTSLTILGTLGKN